MERFGFKTAEELLAWLEQANETMGKRQPKDWQRLFKGRSVASIDKALAKAQKGNFWLGLDRTWLIWD